MGTATYYQCSACHTTHKQWRGLCSHCGEFSTLEEVSRQNTHMSSQAGVKTTGTNAPTTASTPITNVSRNITRFTTGIHELDRVLGGGFVQSEVLLLAGDPGAGKSTLCLSLADRFAAQGLSVLYVSGEESAEQIGVRADRMGVDNSSIHVVHTSSLEDILGHIDAVNPELFIIDSLQAVASSSLTGTIGSVQQSKEAAHVLNKAAKNMGTRAVLINQVNKDGEFAGSESIQHVVDAALLFEQQPDSLLKFLRALKNRFGSTDEVGMFQHGDEGLYEVSDPSGILIDSLNDTGVSGATYCVSHEGIRQFPVEVQALVTRTSLSSPRRQFNGISYNRGQIICAILDKFCSLNLHEHDVFVSTISGVKLDDPQSDLAIAAAIMSSTKNASTAQRTVCLGELSLTGQVRGSYGMDKKVREAERNGFECVVVPSNMVGKVADSHGIDVCHVKSVAELSQLLS